MADINFNTVSVASAVNNSDYLHITTGGSHKRLAVSTLINKAKSETLTSVESSLLDKLTEGCYIMYHRKSDNFTMTSRASTWTTYQNNGEVADGVLLVQGGRYLVVAPTESATALKWASAEARPTISTDRWGKLDALNDFEGKANTAAIIADATIGGDGAGYAPGFCAAYSRSNGVTYGDDKDNFGMKAGSWWLPSLGEMMMIFSNRLKIDTCLQLINGATTLQTGNAYWTSTEASRASAWGLWLIHANTYTSTKFSDSCCVRPVSAFLK